MEELEMSIQHPLQRDLCKTREGQVLRAGGKRYKLLGRIGDGAVGVVRRAEDLDSHRNVAVKFLAPDPKYIDIAAFDEVAKRFEREGTRGHGLRDENLIEIIAYEHNEGGTCFESGSVKNPFIVMEFIRGRTLESIIKSLPTPRSGTVTVTPLTLHIGLGVARALVYLHERRITHRDVKPANVFVSRFRGRDFPSEVKLGDFGVTKWGDFLAASTSGSLTMSHQKGLGTFKYMSPEQAIRPRDVTVRSDVFSLGITLFELFSGTILPTPLHVFQVMTARRSRGTIRGKLMSLDVACSRPFEEELFELILDMFLDGPAGRPTSHAIAGRLGYYFDELSEERT